METLEDFYRRRQTNLQTALTGMNGGHFNVFQHQPLEEGKLRPSPYRRRDYHKIMLIKGPLRINYADQIIQIQKQALFFSNPQIPYNCDNLEVIDEGIYCIFNQDFFHHFGRLSAYSLFQPDGQHVFELTDEQVGIVRPVFVRMLEEIQGEYEHKFDLLRNLVYELIHFGMKLQPARRVSKSSQKASERICSLFLELLERQFPIDEHHPEMTLRTPATFAAQLNIHINHLNRAVKEVSGKTTSQHIAGRVLQEAKIMLRQSYWSISEIAYSLGFQELTHFANFFKKYTATSPTAFRKQTAAIS